MSRTKYFPGHRWGRLVMTGRDGSDIHCDCDCGKSTTVMLSNLISGYTRSCGCGQIEARIIHGHTHHGGRLQSPEYVSFKSMLVRCLNPKHKAFHNYGGAGVQVCDRWNPAKHNHNFAKAFLNFLEDVGPCPPDRTENGWRVYTLGRFGDVGNYEPGNVKWMSRKEQGEAVRLRNMTRKVTRKKKCDSGKLFGQYQALGGVQPSSCSLPPLQMGCSTPSSSSREL